MVPERRTWWKEPSLSSAWEQVLRPLLGSSLVEMALLDIAGPGVYRMPRLRRRSNRR